MPDDRLRISGRAGFGDDRIHCQLAAISNALKK